MTPPQDLSPYVAEAASRQKFADAHHKAVEAGEEPCPDIDWDNIDATRTLEVTTHD